MNKFVIIGLVILGLFGILWFIEQRTNVLQSPVEKGQEVRLFLSEEKNEKVESVEMTIEKKKDTQFVIETVVAGLDTPWSMVFTSPNRILVTERMGKLRMVEDGKLLPEPLHVFSEVSEEGEEGLLSLALDPEYSKNQFLYVVLAYPEGSVYFDKVMRFHDDGRTLSDQKVLIDRIPAAKFHAGSRIAFGPDGRLYITTGDATEKNRAQDKNSLAGKILRIEKDGSIPTDNPFSGSPVWSLGHRNPQGIAWHPDNGRMYETEHGPSGFDGAGGGDEVNLIEKGGNYGWPIVSHDKTREGMITPLIQFTPAEAPASLLIYSGRQFPEWRGNLFFGALKGEGLMRLQTEAIDPKRIQTYEKLKEVDFGRIRDVIEGPDGFIYFTTSNRDGRGTPAVDDDRIFRIRPG